MKSIVVLTSIFCILVSFVLLPRLISEQIVSESPNDDNEVTLRPWEFCQGCKHTVSLYTKVASEELIRMKKKGLQTKGPVEGNSIAGALCEDPSFFNLQPFMRWSCVKVLGEKMTEFIEEFSGQFNANDLRNKADNFKRTRRICGKHTNACDYREFQKANVTSSQRTRCNACRLIAEDIEMVDRSLAKNVTLKSVLSDEFCSSLGYRYYPYQWLETVCEDMIEDKLKDIIGVIDFQKGFRATGMTPDKSTADMMCEEFFKCPIPRKPISNGEL